MSCSPHMLWLMVPGQHMFLQGEEEQPRVQLWQCSGSQATATLGEPLSEMPSAWERWGSTSAISPSISQESENTRDYLISGDFSEMVDFPL